jgi:hypothetical protein
MAMSSGDVLMIVLLVSIVASMVVAGVIVTRSRRRATAALEELGSPLRSMAATALGRTDDRSPTLRGTGTLVLTRDELGFAQWTPFQLLRIRRADITRTDTTREHLDKRLKSEVLRVTWRRAGGEEEAVAFFVRDVDVWLADLGGQRAPEA